MPVTGVENATGDRYRIHVRKNLLSVIQFSSVNMVVVTVLHSNFEGDHLTFPVTGMPKMVGSHILGRVR